MSFDFVARPELRNSELDFYYWQSPHKQIFEDFHATCVKVHDGDTITVRWSERDFDFPIRFANINAPELSEEGGKEAGEWMRERIEGQDVDILINKKDRVDKYGRLLGTIVHRGLDMNEAIVNSGHAKPFSQRDEGKFPNMQKLFAVKEWQI